MSWVMAAMAAVSVAMQIGSTFAEEGSGTQKGLKYGGMGIGLLGGGLGSMAGAGAGAAAGGLGGAGGGLLSGAEMASAAPSLFGGASGAAGAAGGGLGSMGGLLSGGQMGALAPSLFGGGAGAAPGLAAGGGSLTSMLGPVVPNTPSALGDAMAMVNSGGGGGIADSLGGILDAPGMKPPAGIPQPAAAAPVGGTTQPGMMQNLVNKIQEPSAINQALANVAKVQEQQARMQALDRSNRPQAQSPHFFIPQGGKAPTLGTPIARGPSALERYAMLLRR